MAAREVVILSEVETSKLLDALRVKLGFCLPADGRSRIEEASPENARTFTDAVFTGEGLNPELADRHLYRQVLAMVGEAFDGSGAERRRSAWSRSPSASRRSTRRNLRSDSPDASAELDVD